MSGFYARDELLSIGFKSVGEHVLLSKKASVYRPEMISLGHHVRIDDFALLSGGTGIELNNYIHISAYAALYGGGGIRMEDYTGLSPRATLLSASDDFSGESMINPFIPAAYKPGYVSAEIIIRKFAHVGIGSTVMPGSHLDEGAVIGAHSFVNSSCKAWAIYAGIPAVLLKERSRKVPELEERFRSGIIGNPESHKQI